MHARRSFQLGVPDPIGDFLRNRMRKRPGRTRRLRVEIGTDSVLAFQNLFTRAIGHSILNIRTLAARAQADEHTFGSIPRTPRGDFCSEGIDCALRSVRDFRNDIEILTEHYVEFGNELCLHLFHIVGQSHTRGGGEGLDDNDGPGLRRQCNRRESQSDDERQAFVQAKSSSKADVMRPRGLFRDLAAAETR